MSLAVLKSRALAGMALSQLCLAARTSGDAVWPGKAYQRFKDAGNMTDRFNALSALVVSGQPLAQDGQLRRARHSRRAAAAINSRATSSTTPRPTWKGGLVSTTSTRSAGP